MAACTTALLSTKGEALSSLSGSILSGQPVELKWASTSGILGPTIMQLVAITPPKEPKIGADKVKVRKKMEARGVERRQGTAALRSSSRCIHSLWTNCIRKLRKSIAELKSLSGQMRESGYGPDTRFVLHEQKELSLCHHSERLAVAFAHPGMPICVIKNLWVCGDCHSATKFISKIVCRRVVVQDANRFHHFEDMGSVLVGITGE